MTMILKKIVGTLGILLFLALYAMAAVSLHDRLPDHRAIEFLYFAVVGTAWGLPLFPLLSWMNQEPKGSKVQENGRSDRI
ncbi:MAG: DUF2842 domain-containing protein [Caulobacter sp.]|nr:DUF2842 domain-containing protein [Caulobacter sp.]